MNAAIKTTIKNFDNKVVDFKVLKPPAYDPLNHYLDVSKDPYFKNLLLLRHIIRLLCDDYMSRISGAINVDLFMLTPSVSSPMGPGSDSEAIPIQFGSLESFLTDSSQFGFEPVVMNGHDQVYCYLPSMRGENPDKRHLNQFFHCEAEIKGDLENAITFAEKYVLHLCSGILESENLIKNLSRNSEITNNKLRIITSRKKFPRLTFDEGCELLIKNGFEKYINSTEHGRDISSAGEAELLKILKTESPVWLTHFDRDRVPFYQKPDPSNRLKVLNADLLFPAIMPNGFGGEILGLGQRQDTAEEMYESLDKQGLSAKPYEWYINLRRQPNYDVTSGFGLGIERFIAWSLGLDNIQDAIIYPRLKNVLTTP